MTSYIDMVRKLRKFIETSAASLSDEQAIEVPFAYPNWEIDHAYAVGDRVRYEDILYKCLIAHTSQNDWTPDVAHSLFARVLASGGDIPEWEQPDSTNGYMIGDKVRFEGVIYESLIDNNVYSPAAYPAGWKEVE